MRISDLAKATGFSTTTVSSVLTGNGRVSEATRQAVLAKMQEIGYQPNVHARRLATRRSMVVGLDVAGDDVAQDLFVLHLIQATVAELKKAGFGTLIDIRESGESSDLLLQRARERSVDAVILASETDLPSVANRIAQYCPVVVIDTEGHYYHEGVSQVIIDDASGLREVCEYLRQIGIHEVGYLNWKRDDHLPTLAMRIFREAGLSLREENVVEEVGDVEGGRRGMERLLDSPHRPQAVLARKDAIAIGAVKAIRDAGLSVPGDVVVIGHDDVGLAELSDPALTTVAVFPSAVAFAAAGIVTRSQGEGYPVVPTKLVLRDSSR